MLIETKAQFNVLAAQFNDGVAMYSPKPIRSSKLREMLAKAVGFKSHNGLLNGLPVDSQRWTDTEAVERLSALLANHDGIQAPVSELLGRAIDQASRFTGKYQNTGTTRSIEDYAFFRKDDYDDKIIICLTPVGRKVFEKVEAIHDSIPLISSENIDRWHQALMNVIELHPANPWPKAMYCYAIGPSFWQTKWCEALPRHQEKGFMPDPEEGFREYAWAYAEELVPLAKEAITQFEAWLGPNAKNVAAHNLISGDAESFYWPAILYMGGMIALNCGHSRLAKRWLNLNLKLVPGDNFGARYGLSVLRLNDGKGSVQSLFHKDSTCAWGWLARALDAFVRGHFDKAMQHYLCALKNNYGAFEAFGPRLRGREHIRIMSNHAAPAFIEELMFRIQPFWKAHPEVSGFFRGICHDPYVQVRVEDYHRHKSLGIGLAFKPTSFRVDHEKRSAELWEAVTLAVETARRLARPWP